ncbi:MAG: hypothetical protein EBS01_08560, partial [Verrucomicrobia bacterium]|nr:hypothetical protein [Verrucomicrobiota bacterium]
MVVSGARLDAALGSALPTAAQLTANGSVNLFNTSVTVESLFGSGAVTLNGTALTLSNGSFSGALNSTGSLVKTSSGLLTLSGNNGYSGATSVNEGTFTLAGTLASTVLSVASGATFNSESGSVFPATSTLSSDGLVNLFNPSVAVQTLLGAGTVTLDGTALTLGNGTFSGALNSSGSLLKTSAGLLTLSGNSGYTGATTVNGGSLTLAAGGTLASVNLTVGAQGTFNSANGSLLPTAGVLNVDGAVNLFNSGVEIATLLGGGIVALNGTALTLSNGTFNGALNSSGSLIKTSSGLLTLSGNNGYTGVTSVNAGILTLTGSLSSANLTIGAQGTFNSENGSLLSTASVLDVEGAVNLFNSGVEIATLLGAGIVALNGTALTLSNGTFGGALNSSGSLIKTSGGLLTLSGNNGYTGTTSVNAGTLTLTGSLASANLTVGAQGTFNSANGSFIPTASVLNVDGAVNLFNSGVEIAALSGTGAVALNGTALTLSSGTFSGALNSSGSLIKTSSGLLTLSGNNGYTGSTTVNGGSLTLAAGGTLASVNLTIGAQGTFNSANGSLLPTASVLNVDGAVNLFNSGVEVATLLGGGAVALNGTALTLSNGTFGGALNSSGSLVKTSGGLLTLSGNNGYTGATTVNEGSLTLASGGTLASVNLTVGALGTFNSENGSLFPAASVLNVDGAVNLFNSGVEVATLLGGGAVALNGTALTLSNGTFSGALNSSGSLIKTSSGLLTLSGNNGYTGVTSVNAGTLTLTGSLASANLTVGAQGTFNSENGSLLPTASVLNVDGAVNLFNSGVEIATLLGSGAVALNGTALTLSNGTFGGALNSSGSLIKTSGGLLTLSGSNGYTGVTMVNQGSLTLASGGTLASANLTVGVQGTFNSANGSMIPASSVLNVDGAVNLFNSVAEIATLLGGGGVALNGTSLTVSNGTFSGALNSNGSLIKTSGGLLELSGNNGYTGATSVNAGTLTLTGSLASVNLTVGAVGTFNSANGSMIPASSVLNVDGAVNFFNSSVEIATLVGGGNVALNGTVLTLSSGTFAGALNSNGSLIKTGGGLLTLSGNNGYSGTTSVNQGTLTLSGSLASTALVVVSGARLDAALGSALPTAAQLTANGSVNLFNT